MQAYNYLQYAGNLIISRSVGSNSRNSVAEFPTNKNVSSYIVYNHNDFENKKRVTAFHWNTPLNPAVL